MSSFERSLDKRGRYIITARVFPPRQGHPDFARAESAGDYRALVDTGANGCSISERVVADLGLMSHRRIEVMTAGQSHQSPMYAVDIAVAVTKTAMRVEQQDGGKEVMRRVPVGETASGISDAEVSVFPDIGTDRGFDVLLGMDLLVHFHITMVHGKIIISI